MEAIAREMDLVTKYKVAPPMGQGTYDLWKGQKAVTLGSWMYDAAFGTAANTRFDYELMYQPTFGKGKVMLRQEDTWAANAKSKNLVKAAECVVRLTTDPAAGQGWFAASTLAPSYDPGSYLGKQATPAAQESENIFFARRPGLSKVPADAQNVKLGVFSLGRLGRAVHVRVATALQENLGGKKTLTQALTDAKKDLDAQLATG